MSSTSLDSLHYRRAEADDVSAMLELAREALGPGPTRTPDFWQWKHQRNPFGQSPILLACEPDGRLVGMRAFMPWQWQMGTRTVDSFRAVDTATAADWRRRGLFSRLTRTLADDVAARGSFIFNTPNSSSRPGYLKLGWRIVGRLPLMVRIRKPLAVLRLFRSARAVRGKSTGDSLASSELAFDERSWPSAMSTDRLFTAKTGRYLEWRYRDAPGLDYRTVADDASDSLAIVRLRDRSGLAECLICDLLWADGSIQKPSRLIKKLVASTHCDHLTVLAEPATPLRRALVMNGFLPLRSLAPRLIVRPLEADSDAALVSANWCPSAGDLELF